jgi:DNA-binding transcriptional regulator PaaX
MATKQKPAKPANKEDKKQPAAKPAAVTVKQIAKKVGRDERSVRSSIRRILGDGKAVVGKGKRYAWRSWNDPQVKKIMTALKSKAE